MQKDMTFTEILGESTPSACCFTGHREIPAGELRCLKKRLKAKIAELAEEGCLSFFAGGAQGFDTLAAETVLSLKKKYPLRLSLLLPCRDQAKHWEETDVRRYHKILNKADEVSYLSEHYTKFCMHVRNRALVDASSVCIAYMTDASKGGTAYTVRYAEKKGILVYNLAE